MGFVLVIRRYAPFATFGGGFEGDNRTGPSISLTDTARTIGMVPFERGVVGSITASSSGTSYRGLGRWVELRAGRHYSKVKCAVTGTAITADTVSFTASTEGANPMIPVAPDIDTYVDFKAKWSAGALQFEGSVRGDNFPNAEVFVIDAATVGSGCLLFDGRTSGGQHTGPITRLPGSGATSRLGAFSARMPLSASGNFISSAACGQTKM